MSTPLPDIYDYFDYQKYLRDYYEARRSRDTWFSYRFITEKTGVDAGYMAKVFSGKKNIANHSIDKFIKLLKLGKRQSEYLRLMVFFAKARSNEETSMFFEKLVNFNGIKKQKIETAAYQYYTKWYYAAVREVLAYYPFHGDYQELASLTIPEISHKQAKEAMALLKKLNFIKKDSDGRYKPTARFITSGDQWRSLAIRKFQKDTIDLARRALDEVPREQRDISTVTITLSDEGFEILREKIRHFRNEVLELAQNEKNVSGAYHVNVQMLPIGRPWEGGQS